MDDEPEFLYSWGGVCIGQVYDDVHLFNPKGRHVGTFSLRRNTSFRANEIFKDGRYVGEMRKGRLLLDYSKVDSKPWLLSPLPRLLPAPSHTAWPGRMAALDIPDGCADFVA